jgi:hypothetical protein
MVFSLNKTYSGCGVDKTMQVEMEPASSRKCFFSAEEVEVDSAE